MSNTVRLIIPARLWCPYCGVRHIDEKRNSGRWDRQAHTTHRCVGCQREWEVYVSGEPDQE